MEKILISAGGIFNLLVAIFHVVIGKALKWPESIACLDFMNLSVMYILNNHIALTTFIFFVISFAAQKDLMTTRLGKLMLAGMAAFYLIRSLHEFIYYDLEFIFRGFNFLWFIFFAAVGLLYLIPFLRAMKGNSAEKTA